ncbi:MAG: type IV pilus assembly protein PilC [Parcubacteria group bacterium Gr01-1014_56]|nr:MAG: type IV pilus assembly protein PilC [Parcubacteria group bacterium Gr01-1014_56]
MNKRISFFNSLTFVRFSVKEQTLFAKRLSFLVKAGMPLLDCLHLIRKQTRSKAKVQVYDAIIKDVTNGQYLSTSLGKFKRFFGEFAVNIIRVGENSGILSQNLAYLADELSKKHALQRKVVGTLVYPIFITVATLGVTSILTTFIFPKLMPIFVSLHVELPWTTRALIATSEFLRNDWLYLILSIIFILAAWFILRRRFIQVQYLGDRVLLRLPFAGAITRSYNLTNFCRTLGLLLKSGVQVSEAMVITAETTNNLVYRRAYIRIAKCIVKGEPISRQLEKERPLFPDMLTHLVAIGEQTGNLSATCTYLGELYESEVDELTKSLSSSIEPVLMILMGILVGIIAVSVITPIYAITQHLSPR